MPSQAELKKRRVKAGKEQIRQEVVIDRRDRRRRLLVGGFVGLLGLALIAPLVGGIFLAGEDEVLPVESTAPEIPLDTTPPALIDEAFAGASLTGPTPCPATDGTQERTTSFETAPEGCIDPALAYSAEIQTPLGEIAFDLDAAAAPLASNLFVSFSRYGVYENAEIFTFEEIGLIVVGGFGDAGFQVEPIEAPADGVYPIGSVVMLTELGGGMTGQVAIVADEVGAEALATDGTSPIIGTVTSGLDVIPDFEAAAPTTFRSIGSTVTEAAG
ncbi:MAG: hypothetical protein AAF081_05190 [Actinomycetota bacterium]